MRTGAPLAAANPVMKATTSGMDMKPSGFAPS
jgi:hypothetical protein